MLTLLLGGGGAKGYAHIGVISYLEELHIKPQLIVGASMGALIAGFYAAGFNAAELQRLSLGVNQRLKAWLFRPSVSKQGFISGDNITKHLTRYLDHKLIEQLPTRYAALATDIDTGEDVIIDRGELVPAIRAAISVPVIFRPYQYMGRTLTDNIGNSLPISTTQQIGGDQIIAVNVLQRTKSKQVRISRKMPSTRTYNMIETLEAAITNFTSRTIANELKHLQNGILLDIDTKNIGITQFEKALPAIESGYTGATKYENLLRDFMASIS
jgi:predicted acylesterase/phospholipase RssA